MCTQNVLPRNGISSVPWIKGVANWNSPWGTRKAPFRSPTCFGSCLSKIGEFTMEPTKEKILLTYEHDMVKLNLTSRSCSQEDEGSQPEVRFAWRCPHVRNVQRHRWFRMSFRCRSTVEHSCGAAACEHSCSSINSSPGTIPILGTCAVLADEAARPEQSTATCICAVCGGCSG
jgi:hypothetical protein